MLAKMTEPLKDYCVICEKEKETGIHINQAFICKQCENQLIQTNADDPIYKEYVQKLKSINRIKVYQ